MKNGRCLTVAENSAIQWTQATWNVVTGCTQVSPGCANCYIERTPPFRKAGQHFDMVGKEVTTGVTCHPDRLDWPLKWREGRKIFTCSLGDLFHEAVPDDFIAAVFGVMAASWQHTFQVLTKRPERMSALVSKMTVDEGFIRASLKLSDKGFQRFRASGKSHPEPYPWPLSNVWLGTSVENQTWAERRIPLLLETPAAIRFLSVEPLLREVDLSLYLACRTCGHKKGDHWAGAPLQAQLPPDHPYVGVDWVIVGGESGHGARVLELEWVRRLVCQCREAGIPIFVKQLGEVWAKQQGERGRHGGDMNLWPEDLRVREFPEVANATA